MIIQRSRIDKLRNVMRAKGLSAILLQGMGLPSPNVYYFSGYEDAMPTSLILTEDRTVLLTMDADRAKKEGSVSDVISLEDNKISEVLRKLGLNGKRIGIDGGVEYGFYTKLREKIPLVLEDITESLYEIRKIKEREEIAKIREACMITDRVMKEVSDERSFSALSEKGLANRINSCIVEGGREWSFDTIVAGDESSSNVHYLPRNKHFKSLVMIDMGVRSEHYCSDMTRVFTLQKDKRVQDALAALRELHGILEDRIRPRMPIAEAARIAEEFLKRKGYENTGYFKFHSLGHCVGLEVHESPTINQRTEKSFEEGMVFTLEPAVYFRGEFGVRLEDTVVLGKDRIERLTRFPMKEML